MNHWSSATEGEAAGSRTAHLLGEGSPWGGPLSGSLGNYTKRQWHAFPSGMKLKVPKSTFRYTPKHSKQYLYKVSTIVVYGPARDWKQLSAINMELIK